MRIGRRHLLAGAAGLLAAPQCWAQGGIGESPAASDAITPASLQRLLRPGHPRLYLADSEIPALLALIDADPLARDWYGRLQQRAKRALAEPVMAHDRGGEGNLFQVRRALDRIATLAGLYRLDGDEEKAARAKQELLAAAALPSWDLGQFLSTAELSFAVALGYDWLYAYLSAGERQTLETALIDKSLAVGLDLYRQGVWWSQAEMNWNQVCNAGLAIGALAVAEVAPEISAAILDRAHRSIQIAMRKYAPDGGDPEGPMYWNYGGRYAVFYLAALRSALGTDFGLSRAEGFSKTGYFAIATTDPLHNRFNYSDCTLDFSPCPGMIWLGREFAAPHFIEHQQELIEAGAFDPTIFYLIWLLGRPRAEPAPAPLNAVFARTHIATFRSAWNDPAALYVGFKGGDNGKTHSHLDLGSFVLDMLGERWAIDFGEGDYALPGYYDRKGRRWNYLPIATRGHNTLCFAGENQPLDAKAPIVRSRTDPGSCFAIADLTDAYRSRVRSARRGVALPDNRAVLIQDELDIAQPAELVWTFYTPADVALDGDAAVLSRGDKRMRARILAPAGARFTVTPASAPPPETPPADISALQIRLAPGAGALRIAVLIEPEDGPRHSAELVDLARW